MRSITTVINVHRGQGGTKTVDVEELEQWEREQIDLRATITALSAGLESIANNSCCGACQEARLVAKATLDRVQPIAEGAVDRTQPIHLEARLREHAAELINGGTNASELRVNLKEAAAQIAALSVENRHLKNTSREVEWQEKLAAVSAENKRLKERLFPIMKGPAIPWSVIAPHERQALRNHSQTLERLAERGGLSPCEALAVLEDHEWERIDDAIALKRLADITSPTQRADKAELEVAEVSRRLADLKDWKREALLSLEKWHKVEELLMKQYPLNIGDDIPERLIHELLRSR